VKLNLKLPPAMQRMGTRIDAMSLRERGILFVMLLAALFLFAEQVLFPVQRRIQQQLEKQIGDQLTQLNTINGQIERIVREGTEDPDVLLRVRLDDLRKQYAALELSSSDITRGLVTPREMTRLVYSMLRENRALQLVKAENLKPEAIPLAAPAAGTAGPASGSASGPAVYRHGLRLQVKGRYPDIVRYLHTLENLNWRVMWGEVSVQTVNYPNSLATLTIYTLSLDQGWIGV
jgi:MSHA biogenesis protein MshJ